MQILDAMPTIRAVRTRREVLLEGRAQNQEAIIAHSVGELLAPTAGCDSCRRGNGPFFGCVVVPGLFYGSCAGCHFGSHGTRCSFRRRKNPEAFQSGRRCLISQNHPPHPTHSLPAVAPVPVFRPPPALSLCRSPCRLSRPPAAPMSTVLPLVMLLPPRRPRRPPPTAPKDA